MVATFQLKLLAGPNPDQVFALDGPDLVIGRDPSCNLIVNDLEVSRRHGRLTMQPSGFVVEDLGSTNGTFVNGQRITAVTPLQSGDRVSLGDNIILVFEALPKEKIPLPTSKVNPSAPTFIQVPLEPPTVHPPLVPLKHRKLSFSKKIDSKQGKSRRLTILFFLVMIFLCFIATYFIARFLYEAPPAFWCKALPFIFKPELYPQCLP